MVVRFCFGAGTGLQGAAGSWVSGDYSGTSSTTNFHAANGIYSGVAGVIVLPGTQAPTAAQSPLIMRPYDQELLTCQRYWQKMAGGWQGVVVNGSYYSGVLCYPVTPRVAPTITRISDASILNFNTPFAEFISMDGFRATAQANLGAGANFHTLFSVDARL